MGGIFPSRCRRHGLKAAKPFCAKGSSTSVSTFLSISPSLIICGYYLVRSRSVYLISSPSSSTPGCDGTPESSGRRPRGHAHPAAPPPVGSWQSTTHALTQCRERSRLKLAIHVLVYIRILSIRHFFCFLEKGILQKEWQLLDQCLHQMAICHTNTCTSKMHGTQRFSQHYLVLG